MHRPGDPNLSLSAFDVRGVRDRDGRTFFGVAEFLATWPMQHVFTSPDNIMRVIGLLNAVLGKDPSLCVSDPRKTLFRLIHTRCGVPIGSARREKMQ